MTKNRKAKSAARTIAATGVPYVQARRELGSRPLITAPFEIGETFNGTPEGVFWNPAAQPILVITGVPGTGKSAVLHAIAVEATWRGVPILDQGRILPEEFGALTRAEDIDGPTLILLDEHSADEAFTFFDDARQDAEQHGYIFAVVVDGPVEEAPDVAHLELIGQTHFTIGNAEPRTRPWRTAMGTGAMGRYQGTRMFAWGSLDDREALRYAHAPDTTPWVLAAAYDAALEGQRVGVALSPHALSVPGYRPAITSLREHGLVGGDLRRRPYEIDVIIAAPGNHDYPSGVPVVRPVPVGDQERDYGQLSAQKALRLSGELTPDEGAFSTVPVGDSIALDTALKAVSRSTAGPVVHVDASTPEGDVIDLTFSLEHSTPTVVVHDVETLLAGPGALLVKELTDRRKGIFVVDLTPATIVPSRDGMMGRLRMLTRIFTVGASVSVITDRDGRRACFTAEAASCKPVAGSWSQIRRTSSWVRSTTSIGSVTPGEIKLGGLWWTVRGFSATRRFVAVTRTLRGEEVYSVLDLLLGVRGPDDRLFSEGWITDDDVARGLRQMETGEIGISRRHGTTLEIQAQR